VPVIWDSDVGCFLSGAAVLNRATVECSRNAWVGPFICLESGYDQVA